MSTKEKITKEVRFTKVDVNLINRCKKACVLVGLDYKDFILNAAALKCNELGIKEDVN